MKILMRAREERVKRFVEESWDALHEEGKFPKAKIKLMLKNQARLFVIRDRVVAIYPGEPNYKSLLFKRIRKAKNFPTSPRPCIWTLEPKEDFHRRIGVLMSEGEKQKTKQPISCLKTFSPWLSRIQLRS